MQTTTLEIDGMHCAGCVQIVQHVLEQQAGAKGCSVSLAEMLHKPALRPQ
ncbi:MAG: heavy metal-associated domain-containing protein [Salinisphaera sp.]|jgi:copper chaperone|nr:heavy metal-associated domain-containing protein [Salinisphaera sp.]